jgi:hypothetical protein
LAIGIAQPKYQSAKESSHNGKTHVAIILPQSLTVPPARALTPGELVRQFKQNVSLTAPSQDGVIDGHCQT